MDKTCTVSLLVEIAGCEYNKLIRPIVVLDSLVAISTGWAYGSPNA
jgi:hypothetical protein